TPYAIRTLGAGAADALSSACVGCVQDTNINSVAGSKVNGLIPVASVPPGSGSYIQNTTSPQASSNFNISGNGTVGGNLSANGNVGIGTSAPNGKLEVAGNGASAVIGDPNCGAGSNTVAIGFLTNGSLNCGNNFNFGASTTNLETVINRP